MTGIRIVVSGARGIGKSYLIRKLESLLMVENYPYRIKYSDGSVHETALKVGLPVVTIEEIDGPT